MCTEKPDSGASVGSTLVSGIGATNNANASTASGASSVSGSGSSSSQQDVAQASGAIFSGIEGEGAATQAPDIAAASAAVSEPVTPRARTLVAQWRSNVLEVEEASRSLATQAPDRTITTTDPTRNELFR
jgi:hypothetical protein